MIIRRMGDTCNIKVVVRFRPVNEREKNEGADKDGNYLCVEFEDEHSLKLVQGKTPKAPFVFDYVLTPDSEQVCLFVSE